MAHHESDREDLIREATALRRRVELQLPGQPQPVVCGIRADGSLSVYFGADPVYHFDAQGRLRRAFVGDRLYRTQGSTLAELTRVRLRNVTELRRRDLTTGECGSFLNRVRTEIEQLSSGLDTQQFRVTGQSPEDADIVGELCPVLSRILAAGPALAPRIPGKR